MCSFDTTALSSLTHGALLNTQMWVWPLSRLSGRSCSSSRWWGEEKQQYQPQNRDHRWLSFTHMTFTLTHWLCTNQNKTIYLLQPSSWHRLSLSLSLKHFRTTECSFCPWRGERQGKHFSLISRAQRARAVMRLAHISKKSMVWEPCRGERWGALLDREREPGRDELSWDRSTPGLTESMLSLGLWRPAVEPDLCGVDEPDLKPTASMISSSMLLKSSRYDLGSTWYSCKLIFTKFPVTGFFLLTLRWNAFTTFHSKLSCLMAR